MSEKKVLFMREEVKNNPTQDKGTKKRFNNIIFKENIKNLKGLKYVYRVDEEYHYIYAVINDE